MQSRGGTNLCCLWKFCKQNGEIGKIFSFLSSYSTRVHVAISKRSWDRERYLYKSASSSEKRASFSYSHFYFTKTPLIVSFDRLIWSARLTKRTFSFRPFHSLTFTWFPIKLSFDLFLPASGIQVITCWFVRPSFESSARCWSCRKNAANEASLEAVRQGEAVIIKLPTGDTRQSN